jgi:hypothetical protein
VFFKRLGEVRDRSYENQRWHRQVGADRLAIGGRRQLLRRNDPV